jgi:hypothetical protein
MALPVTEFTVHSENPLSGPGFCELSEDGGRKTENE